MKHLIIIGIVALMIVCSCDEDNPVQPTPFSIRVVYPNGGEFFRLNDTVAVCWESGGLGWDTLGTSVRIFLIKSKRKYLDYGIYSNTGLAMWIIDRHDNVGIGNDFKLRIQHSIEPSIWDESDQYFTIY